MALDEKKKNKKKIKITFHQSYIKILSIKN